MGEAWRPDRRRGHLLPHGDGRHCRDTQQAGPGAAAVAVVSYETVGTVWGGRRLPPRPTGASGVRTISPLAPTPRLERARFRQACLSPRRPPKGLLLTGSRTRIDSPSLGGKG